MIGRVYKITSKKTGLVYIGSTKKKLNVRMNKHYTSRRRWLAGKNTYCSSYQILEYDDAKIELIEELEYDDEDELRKREGHYQQTMECVNERVAGRTMEEWNKENKEKMNDWFKKYREEHKEEISAYQKKYVEEHKEEIDAYQKKYYEEHKEAINTQKKTKYNCECGGNYVNVNKSRHMKTKIHQDYINREN